MITVNIPQSLRKNGKFCVWKYIDRDGHKTKCPYDPHTGQFGASNDPKAFSSFAHAHLVSERYGYDGLGVGVFGDVCAIDLDNCITADGKLSEKAKDIISRMHSYTELSPSGKGIHILFRAPHFDYDKSKYYINNQSEGIEAYIAGATNKFVTITGKRLVGSPHDLQERSDQLSEVLETYMRRREWDREERQEGEFTDLHLSDDEILRLMVEHSPRFGSLLNGDISDYDNDQSRADMALCTKLAFYTRDPDQIDRIYRNSGLGRTDGKWDRVQSGSTYGRLTIEKALDMVCEQYHGRGADAVSGGKREALDSQISRAQETANTQRNEKQEVSREDREPILV